MSPGAFSEAEPEAPERPEQTRATGDSVEHMFASRLDRPGGPARVARPDPGSLALLAERVRPVSSSRSHLLPVVPSLAGLLPDGGLRRGTTLVVTGVSGGDPEGAGSISLALALLAAASGEGSWCALVGITGLGAVCAHDLGIDLDRAAVIPRPGPAWAEVTATLVDGVDLVLLCPPFPPRLAMARRLTAKVRERRAVLLVAPGAGRMAGAPRRGAPGSRGLLGRRRRGRGVPAGTTDEGDRDGKAIGGTSPICPPVAPLGGRHGGGRQHGRRAGSTVEAGSTVQAGH